METTYQKLDELIINGIHGDYMFINWADGYPRVFSLLSIVVDPEIHDLLSEMSDDEILEWAHHKPDDWEVTVANGTRYTGARAKLAMLLPTLPPTNESFEHWKRLWDLLAR